MVYVDDFVIFSNSVEEHIDRVDEILQTLGDAGVSVNFEKCKLFSKSITYLGHIIQPGRLEVDRAHTVSIRNAEPSTTVTARRSFLGAANVYRRFIRGFSKIAAPLYNLLKSLTESARGKKSKHEVVIG